MKDGIREIYYDEELNIEAYRFAKICQTFPNHFHNYYVIGLVEEGIRKLCCFNREYTLTKGDIVLFNPNDNHGCVQCDGLFSYKGFNIPKYTMTRLVEEITGEKNLFRFYNNVIRDDYIEKYINLLYNTIINGSADFEKEETMLLLISVIIEKYGCPFLNFVDDYNKIKRACLFIDENYEKHITLNQLCEHSGMSKSTLLRTFTKFKGVTPYRYIQAVRISKAKELLKNGVPLADAAIITGFSDQSHFSNFFHAFMGFSPSVYGHMFKGDNNE